MLNKATAIGNSFHSKAFYFLAALIYERTALMYDFIPISTFFNLLALVVYSAVVRKITNYTFVLAAIIILEAVHQAFTLYMQTLFDNEQLADVVIIAWYFGFAITDFIVVLMVWWGCKKLKIRRIKICDFVLLIIVAMGGLQIIRYLDRIVIEGNWTSAVYQHGIPALNTAVTILLWIYLIQLILRSARHSAH